MSFLLNRRNYPCLQKEFLTFWKHMAPDYNYYIMCKWNEIIQLKPCNIINIWKELFIAAWFRLINALHVSEKVHIL